MYMSVIPVPIWCEYWSEERQAFGPPVVYGEPERVQADTLARYGLSDGDVVSVSYDIHEEGWATHPDGTVFPPFRLRRMMLVVQTTHELDEHGTCTSPTLDEVRAILDSVDSE